MARVSSIADVDQLQLEAYRQMTGEERLRIGLGLYEASRGVAREAIRNRFPGADDATIEEKLRQRIRVGYEIEAASRKSPSPPAPLPKQVRGEGSQRSDGPLPMNGASAAGGDVGSLPEQVLGEGSQNSNGPLPINEVRGTGESGKS